MSSTVIPAKTGKLFFFFFLSFPLIFVSLNSSEKISLAGSMVLEKRVCRIPASFSDFVEFRRDFVGITVDGSLESLLRAFWEKQITVESILGKNA
jgi:hypothetical protein